MRVRLQKAYAAIGFDLPRRDLQKRRFARAVAPDKAQALARADRKIGAFEQGLSAKRERNALKGKKRWGHFNPRVDAAPPIRQSFVVYSPDLVQTAARCNPVHEDWRLYRKECVRQDS
jgi:hypothetical protein